MPTICAHCEKPLAKSILTVLWARSNRPCLIVRECLSGPLLQYTCALADGQPDLRPVPECIGEDVLRPTKIATGIQQAVDSRPVCGPFLDLIEIAVVRFDRVEGFFVGPVVHCLPNERRSGRYYVGAGSI
jgi:hypothetical protein